MLTREDKHDISMWVFWAAFIALASTCFIQFLAAALWVKIYLVTIQVVCLIIQIGARLAAEVVYRPKRT